MIRARRRRRARVVLIGDIGGAETFHVGDEAMFAADLALVRRLLPDAQHLAVSADPEFTTRAYEVDAVTQAEAGDVAAGADLLVVTGGGNLNSSFPAHISARLDLARTVFRSGGHVVLLGQMLGPSLDSRGAEQLRELLGLAAFVGVRDPASAHLARRLGVEVGRLVEQPDDAWEVGADVDHRPALDLDAESYVVVTLHPHAALIEIPVLNQLAMQLDELARATGLTVVLAPHCRAPEGPRATSDESVGAALAQLLAETGTPHRSVSVLEPRETAAIARRSALVLSTRYHPVAFACAGGAPALAIWSDAYVYAKQHGALAAVGLDDWIVGLEDVLDRGLIDPVAELWQRRDELRAWLAEGALVERARLRRRDGVLANKLLEVKLPVDEASLPDVNPRVELVGPSPVPRGRWYRRLSSAPGAVRRSTVIDRVRLEAHADHMALTARVQTRDTEATDVRIRVHDPSLADRLDASATPLLPIAVLLAAATATDLVVDAPVDASLLDGVEAAARRYHDWWGLRCPEVDVHAVSRDRPPAEGVGLWYSRGVDSSDTLLRSLAGELVEDEERYTVTHLLGLDWIDPPYATPSAPAIWVETAAAAARVGLPIVRLTTDVRRVLEPFAGWKQSHGTVLAALGHLFAPILGTVIISASEIGDAPRPLGSHPLLDPLLGTATTRIVHAGRVARSAKVRRIAASEWALDSLKVCWEVDSPRNCGRCAKCLSTMTVLRSFNALQRCDRFDAPLSSDAVWALARGDQQIAIVPHTLQDVTAVARAVAPELFDAWRAVEQRALRELETEQFPGVAREDTDG